MTKHNSVGVKGVENTMTYYLVFDQHICRDFLFTVTYLDVHHWSVLCADPVVTDVVGWVGKHLHWHSAFIGVFGITSFANLQGLPRKTVSRCLVEILHMYAVGSMAAPS